MKPRDRRALLLGIGLITGLWVVLRGLPNAFRGVRALRERTAEQVETLARVEDVVMRGQATRDSMAQTFQAIVALAPDLVDGEVPADAQASLSGLLSLSANRNSLKVLRVDPLPDSAAGPFHRVAMHAELEGDMRGVTGFVGTIETQAPILTITNLSLETSDPLSHPRMSEVLHVTMDVSGYYLPRAK